MMSKALPVEVDDVESRHYWRNQFSNLCFGCPHEELLHDRDFSKNFLKNENALFFHGADPKA
jgi:hypothetical protein